MPWDHINKVINRSLPLQQPSKAPSSHSSIWPIQGREALAWENLTCSLVVFIFPSTVFPVKTVGQKSRKSLCTCITVWLPWCDQGMCLSWNPTAPASGAGLCGEENTGEVESEGKCGWALVAVWHQQSRGTQVRVGAGAQAAVPIASEKPASLLHSFRTHGGLDLAFPELSSQYHSRNPQNTEFYSGSTNPRHLFSDFASKRQNFMHPWGFLRNWQSLRKWTILYFSTIFSVLLL